MNISISARPSFDKTTRANSQLSSLPSWQPLGFLESFYDHSSCAKNCRVFEASNMSPLNRWRTSRVSAILLATNSRCFLCADCSHCNTIDKSVQWEILSIITSYSLNISPLKRTPCTAALLSNLGTVVSLISSILEPEVGVVKETCAKPERRRVTMANRLLWEMVWVKNGTNHVYFYSHRRCCAVGDSQNGIWRNQHTGSEIGASILWWCFRDRKQDWQCWRHVKS